MFIFPLVFYFPVAFHNSRPFVRFWHVLVIYGFGPSTVEALINKRRAGKIPQLSRFLYHGIFRGVDKEMKYIDIVNTIWLLPKIQVSHRRRVQSCWLEHLKSGADEKKQKQTALGYFNKEGRWWLRTTIPWFFFRKLSFGLEKTEIHGFEEARCSQRNKKPQNFIYMQKLNINWLININCNISNINIDCHINFDVWINSISGPGVESGACAAYGKCPKW